MKRDSNVYIYHFSIDFLYYLYLAFHGMFTAIILLLLGICNINFFPCH